MKQRKPIAQKDVWLAYLSEDSVIVEVQRTDTDRRIMIPAQDIHSLWRLLGNVNGYLTSGAAQGLNLTQESKDVQGGTI
jgi:hypothetical protein